MKYLAKKISLRNHDVDWKSIFVGKSQNLSRIMGTAVMLLIMTAVFFLVLGSMGKPVKVSEALDSETMPCPHCGDIVSVLYACPNKSCDNFRKVGCTNPDIDQNGNPKCLFKYVRVIYCRKCNSPAMVVWSKKK